VALRRSARQLVISAFVVFHLSALAIWTMPPCYIKDHFQQPIFPYYMLPLGLWQWWAIFAPDPVRDTMLLDAEVVDCKGMRHVYEFTRLADLPWWKKIPGYRHPKFTGNMVVDEYKKARQFTARHAVRQLGLGAEAFPVVVSLYYNIKASPAPGATAAADPMAPPRIQLIERYEFASMKEVRP
jgi:hypothetical protein